MFLRNIITISRMLITPDSSRWDDWRVTKGKIVSTRSAGTIGA